MKTVLISQIKGSNGEIIVDTVQDSSYEFNHSISFLTDGMRCVVERIGTDVRNRETFAIKKTIG